MLKVTSINQYYGGSHILRDVTYPSTSGQSHGAAGPQWCWAKPRCSRA